MFASLRASVRSATGNVRERLTDIAVSFPLTRRVVIAIVVILVLAWPAGMLWVHKVDDTLPLAVPTEREQPGMSRSVAVLATLVDREARRWTPNAPWFLPASSLTRMPNYQLGILAASAQFANALQEHVARNRGSSSMDPDILQAVGHLKYPGDTWLWGNGNLLPMPTAQAQYRIAVGELDAYNRRLAAHDPNTNFNASGDALVDALDAIASDLGSASEALERRSIESNAAWFDYQARVIFYQTKGRLYTYTVLLNALGQDYHDVLAVKKLEPQWAHLLTSISIGAEMAPWFVCNGPNDSTFIPSTLTSEGFYLLRARTELREITNALHS